CRHRIPNHGICHGLGDGFEITDFGLARFAAATDGDERKLLRLYDAPPSRPAEQAPETDRKKRLEQSLAFWDRVVTSSALLAERMKAQERIDRLLGLECLDVEERLAALEAALAQGGRPRISEVLQKWMLSTPVRVREALPVVRGGNMIG